MYKSLSLFALAIGLSFAPLLTEAQTVANLTTNPVVLKPEDGRNLAAAPDFNLLKKAILKFYQTSYTSTTSDLSIEFDAPEMKGEVSTTISTISGTGGRFNSQITFGRPQSTQIVYSIISNGKKVWIYRPDQRIYKETTLDKFENEKYLIGISSVIFSMISEKDRIRLTKNYDDNQNQLISAIANNPVFQGAETQVDGKLLYIFSFITEKDTKCSVFIERVSGNLSRIQISGKRKNVNINIQEKIKSWSPSYPNIQTDFSFIPPKGVRRVNSLPIMPSSF